MASIACRFASSLCCPCNASLKSFKGAIELSIEYRADGSIGEIKILKGLDKEMDSYAVQAARQNIFLPAIKDGAFVTDWGAVA